MENRYYNYIYLDPRKKGEYKYEGLEQTFEFEPFYIGKGTGKRYKAHNWNYHRLHTKSGRFRYCLIEAIKKEGLKPIVIKLNDNISEKEALENETFLIKLIGRRDLGEGSLTNLKDSDTGNRRQFYSEETRVRMRNLNLGKKLSEEHKKKIGLANKGKISKITMDALKKKIELEGHTSLKIIIIEDVINNTIIEVKGLKEAEKITNLNYRYIQRHCTNKEVKPRFNKQYKFYYKND